MSKSITIIGPTASGKTTLAVSLAEAINGEIISIDSRQFYRGMDIGTGKDLDEYNNIPYHLIDIAEPGTRLNVSDFKKVFFEVYDDIINRKKTPILCGGTGNYLLSLLKDNPYTEIPIDENLRLQLETKTHEEVIEFVSKKDKPKDYTPDLSTKKRSIRALEILTYLEINKTQLLKSRCIETTIYGLNPPTETRRRKISKRLQDRLQNGMIDEVINLRKAIKDDDLIYYGLEYKYITLFLQNELTELEMSKKLETEIHRYAKRQMTFFRKIEKEPFTIHWIDYDLPKKQKTQLIINH